MGDTLQRNLGPVSHLTARQYTIATPTGDPVVCCPKCERASDLDCGVHIGGVVAQIWSCPYADCPFQDYLTLEDWGLDVVPLPERSS